MTNNKQSSVEWLVEQIKKDQMVMPISIHEWMSIFKQAKAMHKEECINLLNTHNDIFDSSEDHYKQTFGE